MLLKKSLYALGIIGMGGLMALMTYSISPVITKSAYADEVEKKPLVVMGAFARASLGNLKNSAAFMSIINHADAANKVIGVTSEIAKRVELHTHIKEGDVMKMRKIDFLDVPAKGFVDLEPGSHHVMLIGLHKPLKAGDKFPITLKFEKGSDVKVEILVKGLGGQSHADHHRGSNAGSEDGTGHKEKEKTPAEKTDHDRGSHH